MDFKKVKRILIDWLMYLGVLMGQENILYTNLTRENI